MLVVTLILDLKYKSFISKKAMWSIQRTSSWWK